MSEDGSEASYWLFLPTPHWYRSHLSRCAIKAVSKPSRNPCTVLSSTQLLLQQQRLMQGVLFNRDSRTLRRESALYRVYLLCCWMHQIRSTRSPSAFILLLGRVQMRERVNAAPSRGVSGKTCKARVTFSEKDRLTQVVIYCTASHAAFHHVAGFCYDAAAIDGDAFL
jgi:hypothetical protein